MRKLISPIALIAIAVLVSCSPPATTTPTPGAQMLDSADGKRVTLVPSSKPTEENPQVTLHLIITDKETGQPVPATIVVDGQTITTFVTEAKIPLPGRITGEPMTLTVTAQGYKKAEVELRWSMDHSRMLRAPIELEPGESPDDSQQGT